MIWNKKKIICKLVYQKIFISVPFNWLFKIQVLRARDLKTSARPVIP